MSTSLRLCPLCERRLKEKTCPVDGVPTVDLRAFPNRTDASLKPGTIIGERYRIVRTLGSGGMGEVFLAKQMSVQREVAVKVLLKAAEGPEPAKRIRRFYKEAQAASALHHPNVVRVFDFGVDGATRYPYLVMELVEGQTLSQLIKRDGPLAERHAAYLLAQVARGLVEAHQKGIVHRDLKPSNIMLSVLADGYEHVRLLDFGIARMRNGEGEGDSRLTADGVAMGTPEYMSPEQSRGLEPGFRCDLYSLGCVLHTMLTGRPPFNARESMAVMMMHVNDPPPLLDGPLAGGRMPSEDLRLLHQSLLAKEPEDRPASTALVAHILQALAQGEQPGVARLLETYHERPSPSYVSIDIATPDEVDDAVATLAPGYRLSTRADAPRAMADGLSSGDRISDDALDGDTRPTRATISSAFSLSMAVRKLDAWSASVIAALVLAVAIVASAWILHVRRASAALQVADPPEQAMEAEADDPAASFTPACPEPALEAPINVAVESKIVAASALPDRPRAKKKKSAPATAAHSVR